MPMTIDQLVRSIEAELGEAKAKRDAATVEVEQIINAATRQNRPALTEPEQARVDDLFRQADEAKSAIRSISVRLDSAKRAADEEVEVERQMRATHSTGAGTVLANRSEQEHTMPGSQHRATGADNPLRFVRASDGRTAGVTRGERFSDHPVVQEAAAARAVADQHVIGMHGGIGNLLRSMSTSSGSAIVPTLWASSIIDRARNVAAVSKAGANFVPMDAKTVQIGRLTTDPTAAFRTEGSTVTASDPAFDNVVLTAKTMSCLVVGSMEWFQDSINADAVVENAIAQAIALQLDYVALFGGLTTGAEGVNLPTPPNPRGILASLLADAPSSVLGAGANGTAQTPASFWREVQQTVFTPQQYNEVPNAMIQNAKLAQAYADSYDTMGNPLETPENIAALQRYTSNQIPSFTQGTMTAKATDLFVGDFTQLIIGHRLDLSVQVLTERYAELGQIGILAHWRGDVALARPRAFAVYRYLQGA